MMRAWGSGTPIIYLGYVVYDVIICHIGPSKSGCRIIAVSKKWAGTWEEGICLVGGCGGGGWGEPPG